jgi:hypothetical protein
MSISIPNKIMAHAVSKQITIPLDLRTLGAVQTNALYRGILTGLIDGDGVPALIARQVREYYGLPIAGFTKYGYFHWWRVIDKPEFFGALTASLLATSMAGEKDRYDYRNRHDTTPNESFKRDIAQQTPYGEYRAIDKKYSKALKNVDLGCSDEVKELVAAMHSGSITTYEYKFN